MRVRNTLAAGCTLATLIAAHAAGLDYPASPKQPVSDTFHGVTVSEDYRWLENTEDPKVVAWVAAQNALTRKVIDALPQRESIKKELQGMVEGGRISRGSFTFAGHKLFALKRQPPKNQAMVVVLSADADPKSERVVLDANELDSTGKTAIDWYQPSLDGRYVAISLSKNGSEDGTLAIYDTETGKPLSDTVPRVQYPTGGGSVAWNAEGNGFFYTRYPQGDERPAADANFFMQVYFHKLGTPASQDSYVLGRDFPRIAEVKLETSEDGRYTMADVANGDGGEHAFYVRGASGEWTQIAAFDEGYRRAQIGRDGRVYAVGLKGTPRGQVVALPLAEAAKGLKGGKVVVPQGEGVIETITPAKSRLYVDYMVGGPSQLRMFTLEGKSLGTLAAQPIAAIGVGERLEGDTVLFASQSYTQAFAWYTYTPSKGGTAKPVKTALAQPPAFAVDGGLKGVDVVREFAVSKDGTRVPVNIISRHGMKRDGTQPVLLTGYGGYGLSRPPVFSRRYAFWLRHGGVVAVVNLRGGGEFGEEWHTAGNLTRKQNVFDDMIASAQLMIDRHYTTPKRLAIEGGSNGGLLMGAVTVQRPELFRAVVSHVGLYDMLRVELTPNGAFNVTEFGTVKDPAQFKALYAYSPMHHVRDGVAYPAMLFTTGAHDGRVAPWMSYKMTARMQAANPQGQPVLLRVASDAGHGIGTSLSSAIEQDADTFAFLFEQLGMKASD
jgi:prolyl oligopeptidase